MTIGDIVVEAVPSYNTNKPNHPQTSDNVGYVVTVDGQRFYHGGDTDVIPEMATIKCDIAAIPIGGKYTMDAQEGVQALETLRPKITIPIHWGGIIGSRADAEYVQAHAPSGVEVRILAAE